MKKANLMVAAGMVAAIVVTGTYSFAARPESAGSMPNEERMALIEEFRAEKMATKDEKTMAQAQKAIDMANALYEKLTTKALELAIEVPATVTSDFETYIGLAEAAFEVPDYKTAKLNANLAKDALEPLGLLIDEAEAIEEEPETEIEA